MKQNVTDCILASFDHREGDKAVLIVGRKRPNESVDIINAFTDQEAIDIYQKLITIKKGPVH